MVTRSRPQSVIRVKSSFSGFARVNCNPRILGIPLLDSIKKLLRAKGVSVNELIVTPASLGYALSAFNKNPALRTQTKVPTRVSRTLHDPHCSAIPGTTPYVFDWFSDPGFRSEKESLSKKDLFDNMRMFSHA